ncbi:MAG: carboxypeptidase-like regulatory domain-containing protein [Longimicrobiales bacterium]|nr:carboxypeptidase-like regulatory domain-containing protein [Longimicrobiales bacterium]
MSARLAMALVALAAAAGAAPLHAQTFRGRVLENLSEAPVATALVSLLSEAGDALDVSIADSAGAYRVEAPEPGTYRLRAERIGFETVETPLLEAGTADAVYPLDLIVRADPLHLPGFTVMTNRLSDEQADREVQLMIGISPASLRFDPMSYEEIQHHVVMGRGLYDAVRASNYAGLITRWNADGPCFSLRARGCLPVYLNGLRLRGDFMGDAPLDLVYRIVLLTPTDGSLVYPSGALLLYTEAWLR